MLPTAAHLWFQRHGLNTTPGRCADPGNGLIQKPAAMTALARRGAFSASSDARLFTLREPMQPSCYFSELPIRQFTAPVRALCTRIVSELPIRQFTRSTARYPWAAISELPIRQFTGLSSGFGSGSVSELPIRQFTAAAPARLIPAFSELPIRQFTSPPPAHSRHRISELPIRQFTAQSIGLGWS